MPLSLDKPGAYAPTPSITDLVDLYRNKSMPTPFTKDVLLRAGVAESLVPRVLQSLQTLDLINDEGMPTETLEGLRRAKEPELPNLMAAWIRGAYAEVLSFVEPNDPEVAIRDAFRSYNPVGQQSRMVALFLGLCRAAGLRDAGAASEARPTVAKRRAVQTKPKPTRHSGQQTPHASGNLPSAIAGLLASLPPHGSGWTNADRKKFLTTFEAVLDFSIPVVEKSVELIDEIDPLP